MADIQNTSHQSRHNLKYPFFKRKTLEELGAVDRAVYKYLPLKHLLPSLDQHKLFINKVDRWEDVYENFLFKQELTSQGRLVNWISHTDGIYGQSWTLLKSSDAMWRIYSHLPEDTSIAELENTAIRVQTNIEKLFDVAYSADDCMATMRMGEVNYLDDNALMQWMLSNCQIKSGRHLNELMFGSLLIKRKPFEHEQELRWLKILDSQTDHPDFLSYDINPSDFFEEFVIDPRIQDNSIIEAVKNLINDKIQIPIRQSQLYKLLHRVTFTI